MTAFSVENSPARRSCGFFHAATAQNDSRFQSIALHTSRIAYRQQAAKPVVGRNQLVIGSLSDSTSSASANRGDAALPSSLGRQF